MTLVGYELKKLLRLPALWVFLVLCLALNCLLVFSGNSGRDFFNETSAAASVLGQRVDENFPRLLSAMPHTENRDILLSSVTDLTDPFDSYDTAALSEVYEKQAGNSPIAVAWLQQKYDTLSPRVVALAGEDTGMDLYAGPITHDSHQFLFGTLLRAISAESSILGVLIVLYLFGYEHMVKTELAVCTMRKGRRLWQTKAAAGIIAALLMFLALTLLSLSVYFSVWDYSGIWNANVSSQFNYIQELFVVKPFLTWGDFTVAGYLAASLGMIAALTIIFCLAAAILGFLIRNTYTAAVLLLLLCAGGISLEAAFSNLGLWTAYALSCFQPISLWMTQNLWFTESGISTILPWQEIITACLWLLLGGGGTALALRRFYRKDLA